MRSSVVLRFLRCAGECRLVPHQRVRVPPPTEASLLRFGIGLFLGGGASIAGVLLRPDALEKVREILMPVPPEEEVTPEPEPPAPVFSPVSPQELCALSEEEAVKTEMLSFEVANREQLKERVLELTQYLAAMRLSAKAKLEETLSSRLEAMELYNLTKFEEAIQQHSDKRDAMGQQAYDELQAAFKQIEIEEVARVTAEVKAVMEQKYEDERLRLSEIAEKTMIETQGERVPEIMGLAQTLEHVEKVISQDSQFVQRAHVFNSLSAAVLGLEDAILRDSGAEQEFQALSGEAEKADAFTSGVVAKLPRSSVELCMNNTVPTEQSLRHSFWENLDDLATMAFAPPSTGPGGQMLAFFFRKLYILDEEFKPYVPEFSGQPEDSHVQELRENLNVISHVLHQGESAELRDLITYLQESLKGTCHERAMTWTNDIRNALLVRQTLSVVKARVSCLTAVA